jgi:hypothetical protein
VDSSKIFEDVAKQKVQKKASKFLRKLLEKNNKDAGTNE